MSLLERIIPIPIGFHLIDMTNNPEYDVTDESELNIESANPIERQLAQKSQEEEGKYDEHFKSKRKQGGSKFQVKEDQLKQEKKKQVMQKEGQRETEIEKDGR